MVNNIYIYMVIMMINDNLVGGWPTPLKNMSSSVGMITIDYSQYMEK